MNFNKTSFILISEKNHFWKILQSRTIKNSPRSRLTHFHRRILTNPLTIFSRRYAQFISKIGIQWRLKKIIFLKYNSSRFTIDHKLATKTRVDFESSPGE